MVAIAARSARFAAETTFFVVILPKTTILAAYSRLLVVVRAFSAELAAYLGVCVLKPTFGTLVAACLLGIIRVCAGFAVLTCAAALILALRTVRASAVCRSGKRLN